MANRRRAQVARVQDAAGVHAVVNPRRTEKNQKARSSAHHEPMAVALAALGVLTLLSLLSYHSGDASLNASGRAEVRNWIGPAGAYWSDLLLQALGIGSYALSLGLFLAGWRALVGKRILPGLREAFGTSLLVVCVGALAHLAMVNHVHSYPAGGVLGAILARLLLTNFAVIGAYILSIALVLAALALTADGILAGLGMRGLVTIFDIAHRGYSLFVTWREKNKKLQAQAEVVPLHADERNSRWTLGETPKEERRQQRQKRIDEAKERGIKLADDEIKKQTIEAKERAVREVSEPDLHLDNTVDLPVEEQFELGTMPPLDDKSETATDKEETIELHPDDVQEDVPIVAAAPLPVEAKDNGVEKAGEKDAAMASAQLVAVEPKRLLKKKSGDEPEIVDVRPTVDPQAILATQEPVRKTKEFELPSPNLLDYEAAVRVPLDTARLKENAIRLTKTLKDYGIDGQVREIRPGPVVTMYEYVPGPGIKLSKIAGLADDIAMSMAALRVRIVAPIPGKGAVGIEIPNDNVETVYLKEIIAHDNFRKSKNNLALALGKDIEGNAYAANLAKMPHLLVAGATGAGKSVAINGMIMSILFKSTPEEVRMIMVDPKMLELSVYEGIPHLLLPVVTDPKKAALALRWAVEEMERRYHLLSEVGARSIDGYNQKVKAAAERGEKVWAKGKGDDEAKPCSSMPYIVVIVDELADLMMVASRDVEASIMRLAQMARAAGIHLILATQRPSVDVITGVIKANFPTRMAFQVASKHDSRTIIDQNGAEHLLGKGDMLYLSPGAGGIVRVHGAYVSEEEIERTVNFLKEQGQPTYDETILAPRDDGGDDASSDEPKDEMYDQAVAIVSETRQASISMIQRRLRIGYNRAARLVEQMEAEGIVGPADGAKPREVLVNPIAAI